ncbi:restriction endonuclease subunit S [uncultured Marinobacter sp.]|uniref:restriction endonuclease subunit S n=1 Tax=uncultured Marinobacter sp. TaxID=187379 RepID=UPI0030DDDC9E
MKETDHAPESWARCSLADIVVLNPKNDASAEQTAGFVPMALAPTDYHGALQHEEKVWGEIKKSYTNFADGDVIFAKVTPCFENGKAAIVRDMPSGIGAGSSEFYVLRPTSKEISPSLLFAIIKTQSFMQQGAENMTGAVGLRRVPRAFVESFPIALPPAAEQKVIADKLDTLLAQVENTKARLERIPQILKRFRQSVLAAAVSGRLTEEWREQNAIAPGNTRELDEVIESSFYGPRFSKNDYTKGDSGVPTIRTTDMKNGTIRISPETPKVEVAPEKLDQFKLIPGDLLITRTGSIGVMALFEGDYIAIPSAYLIRFRLKPSVDKRFIYYALTSPDAQQQMGLSSTAITQPNINAKSIRALKITLPTQDEQTEIVRRVDQLFAHADRIEQQVTNALARVNNLTQSILAKAFRGELTEQWRKDNPTLISGENSAEALLERIKAERAAVKPVKKTRKTVSS